MSDNNEESRSPNRLARLSCSSEYGISPMSNLSANLGSNLQIRRNLTFHSNDSTPRKCTSNDSNAVMSNSSPNRMLKFTKISTGVGGGNGVAGDCRTPSAKRSSHSLGGVKAPTDKENSSRRSYSMEYSADSDDECSPSKFAVSRCASRCPLEDHDPNSRDSGYSNSSYLFSEDSKSNSNFRFAEPNGVPLRRSTTVEFSPNRDASPSSRKSNSPRYHKQPLHRMPSDFVCSDFSDDEFGDNAILPSVGSLMMEHDENVRLPPGFSALPESILTLGKISESANSPMETTLLHTSFGRSLAENVTPKRTIVRSSIESDLDELLSEKESLKRTSNDAETGPFLKRRKSSWTSSGPATAPPTTSTRGTLFSYGFKKTSVKFQRSFSETEATIKSALQRAVSDPNLIGDFSKPFVLPLKMGRVTDLKNIDCHTLAKLMNGGYEDVVSSYTIIDCRYPYEYEGGHIKGAVNIYTQERMMEELNEKKLLHVPDTSALTQAANKRSILIFHCEFSSERGPSLSRYLRNADREKNSLEYPKLDYPEIYLLEGGYQNFFHYYKDLCEPRDYVKMVDPNHSDALRKLKVPSKSWACPRDSRKSRNSYKRLGI